MEILINNTTNGEIFTTLFQHMKLFTEHVNVYFREDELFIQGMDKSHVSIFEIKLPKGWFDKYELSKSTILGINTNILFKVLNTREKTHDIQIKQDEENDDKLEIHLLSQSKDVVDLHYIIPLIEIDSELMSIPEMNYQAELSLPSSTFSTLIDQMKMFGETLNIKCTEEQVQMISESQDSGKMFVNIPMDDLNSFAIEEEKELDLSFSIAHLKNICLYSKIAKEIEINLTENYPIQLVYHLNGEIAKAIFYLAPKIDD